MLRDLGIERHEIKSVFPFMQSVLIKKLVEPGLISRRPLSERRTRFG